MAWLVLVIAGIAEIGFTTCLKLSENFTRPIPSVGFVVLSVFSFVMLTKAIQTIPLGTAYAVWTGIGAFGTAIIGVIYFKDPMTGARLALLALLIGSVIGLKVISGD